MLESQEAMRRLFDGLVDRAGNMPPLPGIYPDYTRRLSAMDRRAVSSSWRAGACRTPLQYLAGKKVATESSSTAANDIKNAAPKAKVQLFEENNDCLQAVQQGRVDAYVLDQGILVGDASTNSDVKVVGQPFTTEPYGIGLPKDDPAFKKVVNDWLTKIEQDGTWAKLWKATIGTVVSGEAPKPPKLGSVEGS